MILLAITEIKLPADNELVTESVRFDVDVAAHVIDAMFVEHPCAI